MASKVWPKRNNKTVNICSCTFPLANTLLMVSSSSSPCFLGGERVSEEEGRRNGFGSLGNRRSLIPWPWPCTLQLQHCSLVAQFPPMLQIKFSSFSRPALKSLNATNYARSLFIVPPFYTRRPIKTTRTTQRMQIWIVFRSRTFQSGHLFSSP